MVATFARWKGQEVFLQALSRLSSNALVRGYYKEAGLDVTIEPLSLQLQGARFIPHKNQICGGFWMMRVERDRAFVVQDSLAEISETEPRVAQIIEHICAPLPGVDEILVTVGCFLEMSFAVILVCLRKYWMFIFLSGSRGRTA